MSRSQREVLYPREANGSVSATFHFDPERLISVATKVAEDDKGIHGDSGYTASLLRLVRTVSKFVKSRDSRIALDADSGVMDEMMTTILDKGDYLGVDCSVCATHFTPSRITTRLGSPTTSKCPAGHVVFRSSSVIR